jgi:rRNA-processing arch domain
MAQAYIYSPDRSTQAELCDAAHPWIINNAQCPTFRLAGGAAAAADEFVDLSAQLAAARGVVQAAVTRPDVCLPFLPTGRLVRLREGATDWGWGVILTTMFKQPDQVRRLQLTFHTT